MAYYFGKFYPQRPHRYAEYMLKDFKPFVKYWVEKDQKLIHETLKFIMREEPDLLSWLENTGRLVAEKDGDSQEISTIEEEELSALMGEKEDYKTEEDPSLEDDWED